jgi:hypothetical protein
LIFSSTLNFVYSSGIEGTEPPSNIFFLSETAVSGCEVSTNGFASLGIPSIPRVARGRTGREAEAEKLKKIMGFACFFIVPRN